MLVNFRFVLLPTVDGGGTVGAGMVIDKAGKM